MAEYIYERPEQPAKIVRDGWNVRVEWDFKQREPIVRCRDCKHFLIEPWDEVLAAQYGAPPMICERTGDMDDVVPDGFCAWAKRRDA